MFKSIFKTIYTFPYDFIIPNYDVITQISTAVQQILKQNDIAVVLGGDHRFIIYYSFIVSISSSSNCYCVLFFAQGTFLIVTLKP